MGGQPRDPPARDLAAALKFQREHQHGQLGHAIGLERDIGALRLQVGQIDRLHSRREAADIDDARSVAAPQQRQQARRQGEMAEIVGGELQLESIGALAPLGQRHDARVIDQQIDAAPCGEQLIGEGCDRGERRKIKLLETYVCIGVGGAQALKSIGASGLVAARQHNLGARPRKRQRRLVAEPARRPGDDGEPPALRRNIDP